MNSDEISKIRKTVNYSFFYCKYLFRDWLNSALFIMKYSKLNE